MILLITAKKMRLEKDLKNYGKESIIIKLYL